MIVTERLKGSLIRRILLGLITDDKVLARISSKWKKDLFAPRWANLIAGWCVEYHQKNNRAPGKAIEGYFAKWSRKTGRIDNDSVKIVEKLLTHISQEYQYKPGSLHASDILEQATDYFAEVAGERLIRELQHELDEGDLIKFKERYASYASVDLKQQSEDEDISSNPEIISSFYGNMDYFRFLRFPGEMQQFLYGVMERGKFVAFQAAEKIGKSYMIQDILYRGWLQRKKVGLISIGDLTRQQVAWRWHERMCMHPLKSQDGKWPYECKLPYSIEKPDRKKKQSLPKIKWKRVIYKEPLHEGIVNQVAKDLAMETIRSKNSFFKMRWFPNFSVSMDGVLGVLREWDLAGYRPDIVGLDYADLLLPQSGKVRSEQENIDMDWKLMRKLSQEFNCLLITATQAARTAYKKQSQDRSDVGRDKRKTAHVDAMIALNQTDEEKELEVYRWNYIAKREGVWSARRYLWTAGCLSVASPAMVCTV